MKSTSKQPHASLGAYEPIRRNTKEIELKVLMNLLALELLDPTSADQIAALLKKIPEAALTKHNKITGNFPLFVRRLMLSELAGGAIKIDATEIKMAPKDLFGFTKLISPVISEAAENNKLKSSERNAAEDLQSWIELLHKIEVKTEPTTETNAPSETTENPAQEDAQCDDAKASSIDQITTAAKDLNAILREREEEIKTLRSTIASVESEIARLKNREESLKNKNTELQATLDKSRKTVADLNAENASLKQRIERLSNDLSANKQMVEFLEQAGSRQSNETIKRISRKLKIEFDDYRDAIDLDMDADLGENMRLQLGSIFQILKENGFEL